MSSTVAKAASTTKVAEPVVTVVSAPKSKTVVPVSPVVAAPVITSIAPTVTEKVAAKTTTTAPGGDTVQPATTGAFVKVKTASPVTGVASYVTYY